MPCIKYSKKGAFYVETETSAKRITRKQAINKVGQERVIQLERMVRRSRADVGTLYYTQGGK